MNKLAEIEANMLEGVRRAFANLSRQIDEKHATDRTALLSTIEAKLREAVFAGEMSVNDAQAVLAEIRALAEATTKAATESAKAVEVRMRDNETTLDGWFDLAETRLLKTVGDRLESGFDLLEATAKASEAVRDARAAESRNELVSALRSFDEHKHAVAERIRTVLDKAVAEAEAVSRTLMTMVEDGSRVLERLAAADAESPAKLDRAIDIALEKTGTALQDFTTSAAEAIERWREHATAQANDFSAFLESRQEDIRSSLADEQRSSIADIKADINTAVDAAVEGLDVRFTGVHAELVEAVREGMELINLEHGESLKAAQAIIEDSLAKISASVETHVAAMLGAEVEKALKASPVTFRGERGETGAQGEPGAPGPRGERGVDGTSIGFVGIWSEALEYRPGDVVQENGSTWLAKRKTHGEQPSKLGGTENPPWTLVAMRGIKGERGLRGERGERGMAGPAGAAAPVIIELAFVDDALALVLEDGSLIKAKFDERLIKRIAAYAARIAKGEVNIE